MFHRISQFSFDSAFFSLAVFVVVVVWFSLDRHREIATESERRQLSLLMSNFEHAIPCQQKFTIQLQHRYKQDTRFSLIKRIRVDIVGRMEEKDMNYVQLLN